LFGSRSWKEFGSASDRAVVYYGEFQVNSKRLLAYLAIWEAQVARFPMRNPTFRSGFPCFKHHPRCIVTLQQQIRNLKLLTFIANQYRHVTFSKINGMVWCCSGVVDYSGKKIIAQQRVNGVLVLNG
jgi:hypothetical protein